MSRGRTGKLQISRDRPDTHDWCIVPLFEFRCRFSSLSNLVLSLLQVVVRQILISDRECTIHQFRSDLCYQVGFSLRKCLSIECFEILRFMSSPPNPPHSRLRFFRVCWNSRPRKAWAWISIENRRRSKTRPDGSLTSVGNSDIVNSEGWFSSLETRGFFCALALLVVTRSSFY